MCGDSRHDLNLSEIPNSWGELFDNLEYVMLSICVGLSASMHDKMVLPTIRPTHIGELKISRHSSDLVGKAYVFRPDLELRDSRTFTVGRAEAHGI